MTIRSTKRILFVGEPFTPSHLMRPYILADQVATRMPMIDVHFATSQPSVYSPQFPLLGNASITYHALPSIFPAPSTRIKRVLVPYYEKHEVRGMIHAEKILINQIKPDYIIHDFRHTLAISSQLTNIPLITLNDFYWSNLYRKQAESIVCGKFPFLWRHRLLENIAKHTARIAEAIHIAPYNAVANEYGMNAFSSLRNLFTYGKENWFYDVPTVAPFLGTDTNKLIGPMIWQTNAEIPKWIHELRNRSAICISFGSSSNPAVLQIYVDVLKKFHTPLIVLTAGRVQIKPEPGVYVADFIPLAKVLEKSKLCICHGGSSIVYSAINAHVPVLGTPSNMAQLYSMHRFAELGAGLLLPKCQMRNGVILSYVNNLLQDQSYIETMAKMQRELLFYQPFDHVSTQIKRLFTILDKESTYYTRNPIPVNSAISRHSVEEI